MCAGSAKYFEIVQWQCSTGFHEQNALLVVILEENKALGIRDFNVFMDCCSVNVTAAQACREVMSQFLLSVAQSFE